MEDAIAVSSIVCTGLLPFHRHVGHGNVAIDPFSIWIHITTNGHIILHLVNAVLIFSVGKILFRRLRNYNSNDKIKYALVAPILFNLHPIHTTAFNEAAPLMPYLSLCIGLLTVLLYFSQSHGLRTNILCLVMGLVFLYISNTFTWQGAALVIAYSQSKSWTFILLLLFISHFYFIQVRDHVSFDYVDNVRHIFASTNVKFSMSRLSAAIVSAVTEFGAISGTRHAVSATDSITTAVTTILLLVTAFNGAAKIEVNGTPWQVLSCGLIALFFVNYTYITNQLMNRDCNSSDNMMTERYISLSIVCIMIGFIIVDIKRGIQTSLSSTSDNSNALVYKISPFFSWVFYAGVESLVLAMVIVTLKTLLLTIPEYVPSFLNIL